MKKGYTLWACLLFLLKAFSLQAEADPMKESAEVASEWLSEMDKELYAATWDKASPTLQLKVPKQHWVALMEQLHKPLGKMTSRKMIEQKPAKDPANLPKGDYMVIVYETIYAIKGKTHELVTLSLGFDNKWHVLTYHVQ